jgi:hypothetical protein
MKTKTTIQVITAIFWLALILAPSAARAQFLGHNLTGDFGLMSATQPDPGTYLSLLYYGYRGDTLRDRDGNAVAVDPERRGSLDANGYGLGIWHVTDRKILGGNYSFMIWPAFTDNNLEAPILGLDQGTSTGFTDLYFQPINLGWHTDQADYTAGIGVFAPTGRYEAGADDNLGLGMWSFELFAGATFYLDQTRTWNFATTAFYEIHTEKKDSDIRVGDILTLEGGLGKSFMDGAMNAGIAYYAQWKTTDDDFGANSDLLPPGFTTAKNRGFGLGPEINIPLASKSKLWGFLNARYFWESGNRSTVEGETFVLTLTLPIPSVPLQ